MAQLCHIFTDDFNTESGVTSGDSFTGDAEGGRGNNRGPGGNAISGNAGSSNGGNIGNEAGTIGNTDSSEFEFPSIGCC